MFILKNKYALVGMSIGLLAGYLYWYFYSCYWGTYPLSSECWVNCAYGSVFGGFFATLLKKYWI